MLTVQTPAAHAVETTPAAHAVETTPALPIAQVQAQAVLVALPQMTEEEVIATARATALWVMCAYIVRGACAAELLSRQPMLVGGRGKKDVEGQGRRAYLARLAAEFGIEPRTLLDDMRIHERFFAVCDNEAGQSEDGMEARLARYSGLGRDHFRVALASPDPAKAIEAATGAGQDGVCSVRQMRAIVQGNKATVQPAGSLVFDVKQCAVSDPRSVLDVPVSAVNTSLASAMPAGVVPWEEMLGEETAVLLQELVAQHNAAYPTDTLDPVGYIRHLVQQAVRHVDKNLAAEADMSLAPVFELTPA